MHISQSHFRARTDDAIRAKTPSTGLVCRTTRTRSMGLNYQSGSTLLSQLR